jgi:hypothetical protein
MQYWIEQKSAKLNYMRKSELLQLVEKKGKRASAIAWNICRPKIGWADSTYKAK